MVLKLTGALIIGAAGTAIGLYFSNIESNRINNLIEFKKAFLILSSEIEYMGTALPEASYHIAQRTSPPVSDVFASFATLLENNSRDSVYTIWMQSLEENKSTRLTEEDWKVLYGFGKTLGYLDKQMQLNAIKMIVEYIDTKVETLKTDCEKNKKMYRSLGMLGGLLLAVLLW